MFSESSLQNVIHFLQGVNSNQGVVQLQLALLCLGNISCTVFFWNITLLGSSCFLFLIKVVFVICSLLLGCTTIPRVVKIKHPGVSITGVYGRNGGCQLNMEREQRTPCWTTPMACGWFTLQANMEALYMEPSLPKKSRAWASRNRLGRGRACHQDTNNYTSIDPR